MNVLTRISLSPGGTSTRISLRWIAKKRPYFPEGRLEENSGSQRLYGSFMLLIPVTAFGLGYWQVLRRRWKMDLIKKMKERTKQEPVPLPQDLREVQNLEYYPIKVSGVFDHDHEIIILNRHRGDPEFLLNIKARASDLSRYVGAHVVTPFAVSGRSYRILVNRGWVPREKLEPDARQEGQVKGEVEIVGINRLTEKKPFMGMENNPFKSQWYYRNVDMMAKFLDTAPVYLEETIGSSVPGGPIGSQTNVMLFNQHLVYIVVWFTVTFFLPLGFRFLALPALYGLHDSLGTSYDSRNGENTVMLKTPEAEGMPRVVNGTESLNALWQQTMTNFSLKRKH